MLLIEDNLTKHRSLASLLSLSQCGFGLFFYSLSLAILKTQNNFTKPLLLQESAAAVCCLPLLYNQNGVSMKTDTWLTKTNSDSFTPCLCSTYCCIIVLTSPCCQKVGHLCVCFHHSLSISLSLTHTHTHTHLNGSVSSNRNASDPSRLPVPLM